MLEDARRSAETNVRGTRRGARGRRGRRRLLQFVFDVDPAGVPRTVRLRGNRGRRREHLGRRRVPPSSRGPRGELEGRRSTGRLRIRTSPTTRRVTRGIRASTGRRWRCWQRSTASTPTMSATPVLGSPAPTVGRPRITKTSMKIGSEMVDHMEDADAETGLTECPTCSMQMEHGTGYEITTRSRCSRRRWSESPRRQTRSNGPSGAHRSPSIGAAGAAYRRGSRPAQPGRPPAGTGRSGSRAGATARRARAGLRRGAAAAGRDRRAGWIGHVSGRDRDVRRVERPVRRLEPRNRDDDERWTNRASDVVCHRRRPSGRESLRVLSCGAVGTLVGTGSRERRGHRRPPRPSQRQAVPSGSACRRRDRPSRRVRDARDRSRPRTAGTVRGLRHRRGRTDRTRRSPGRDGHRPGLPRSRTRRRRHRPRLDGTCGGRARSRRGP